MAFGEPERDAYGNPISIPPHNQVVIGPDNLPLARRTKMGFGDGFTLFDDPDSDCTRINVGGNSGSVSIVDTAAALRSLSPAPQSSLLYRTRGAIAANDGGGAFFRWDPTATDVDDGVIVLKRLVTTTGRFRYVDMSSNKIYNALCAVPQIGSSRSVSFDPTGTTAMRDEMWRVTKILRDNGFGGIHFPGGVYKCFGDEQVGASSKPMVSFALLGSAGTIFRGPAHGPNTLSVSLSVYAYCYGDTFPTTTIIQDNNPNKPSWTQTFLGYERTLGGTTGGDTLVSDVVTDNLQPGDQIATYLGAEPTDANGWCARWQIGEIASVTRGSGNTGSVTMVQPIPGPMPPNSGLNTIRTTQTFHTLKKLSGFQDGTSFIGITFDNVSVNPAGARNFYVDCTWDYAVFGLNLFMVENIMIPRLYVKTATGVDIGGGGAFAHYGGLIAIQSCYSTFIGSLKVDNLDGVFLIDEELSPNGTYVGTMDVTVNGQASIGGHTQMTIGQSSGIEIGTATIRGGYGFLDFSPITHISTLNLILGSGAPGSTNTLPNIRTQNIDRITYNGRTYRQKASDTVVLPIPVNGSKTYDFPSYGMIANMRMNPSSLTGVTTLNLLNSFGSTVSILGLSPTANAWNDINPAQDIAGYGNTTVPNITSLQIVTDNTAPAGGTIEFEIVSFQVDPINGSVNLSDNTYRDTVSGNVAPTANAKFIGQKYFDTTGLVVYDAVGVGGGSADWVARGLPNIHTGGIYGNAAFTPQITLDDQGRATNISGLAIAIDAGQVNAGTMAYARLPVGYPVIITPSTDYTASSLSASWTAGAYSRIEIRLDTVSGSATDPTITLTGAVGSVYSGLVVSFQTGSAGTPTQTDQLGTASYALTGLGQNSQIELDISCANTQAKHVILRGTTIHGADILTSQGACRINDFSHAVSGITITFAASTQGRYSIIGWP